MVSHFKICSQRQLLIFGRDESESTLGLRISPIYEVWLIDFHSPTSLFLLITHTTLHGRITLCRDKLFAGYQILAYPDLASARYSNVGLRTRSPCARRLLRHPAETVADCDPSLGCLTSFEQMYQICPTTNSSRGHGDGADVGSKI